MPGVTFPSIKDLKITEFGVFKLLDKIDVSKASGPDCIPGRIPLQNLARELAPVLHFIFEQSLNTGDLPAEWTLANVSPIFKKGSKLQAVNYRPVSLTCISCKLFEHIVCKHILGHLEPEDHEILTDLQHGFRSGRSCETQLITTFHDIASAYNKKGSQIDIAVLDFSKAFDTVPHESMMDFSVNSSINTLLLDTPRLKDGDQDICEGLITLMECDLASQKMKLDKSPGLDGIPIEFYHTFWHMLGSFLIKIYNESFQLEKLCNSQRTSVLSLLHKKGDVNLLKNYRPISLTNVDYRILGQVLANRLHKVLPTLISHDQAGYVKGRYIGNNIRAIEDLILYAEKENVNSIICFLDFQKAFDSVEWECIYRVLKKFNIGNDYIQWIKTLYYKPKITIKNNGWLTDYIELQRSVRQGCSVSALLFILVMEILAIKIKNDNSITGIQIDRLIPTSLKNEIKILQYADDLILTLANEESLRKCLKIVREFSEIAGPVLNINKSEIIGTCQYKTLSEIGNIKTTDNANCLGIYVGHDKTVCNQKNWYDKIEKLQSTLATWSKRNLTIFGSVTIIKALAISKVVFSVQNTSIPSDVPELIEKILYKFIWKNRGESKGKL